MVWLSLSAISPGGSGPSSFVTDASERFPILRPGHRECAYGAVDTVFGGDPRPLCGVVIRLPIALCSLGTIVL